MTQQPFSRPGAVDLSALKRPAAAGARRPARAPGGSRRGRRRLLRRARRAEHPGHARGVDERAGAAGVLLADPDARQRAARRRPRAARRRVRGPLPARQGRRRRRPRSSRRPCRSRRCRSSRWSSRAGRCRCSRTRRRSRSCARAHPGAGADGHPGRHRPAPAARRPPARAEDAPEEEYVDPRYAPAQDALEAGDIDGAVAEYQKLVDANPADTEAAAGPGDGQGAAAHRRASTCRRPARPPRPRPDDVDAQTLVADLDMLGGHVDDAFDRLIDLVRRTVGRRARPGPPAPAGRCSPRSATTTRACSRAARAWPPRSSEPSERPRRRASTDRPASSRATGTRNGEQDT